MKRRWHGAWSLHSAPLMRSIGYVAGRGAGLALTLVLATVLAWGLFDELESQQTSIMRPARVESEVEQLRALVFEFETATRAYMIFHHPVVFEPARRAWPLLDARLDNVRLRAEDKAPDPVTARKLKSTIQRLGHLPNAAVKTTNRHRAHANDLPEARQLQGRIRTLVDTVGATQRARCERSTGRSARTRFGLKAAMVVSILLLVALSPMWLRAPRPAAHP